MSKSHLEMVDAVNAATTEVEHRSAELRLEGWREAASYFVGGWSGVDADNHSMAKYGEDRPMCCGVLLDWSPCPRRAGTGDDEWMT